MASYGTTTADVIQALNNLPNSYAGKILKDIIVDTMKEVTETLTNKTLTSPTITSPTVTGTGSFTGTSVDVTNATIDYGLVGAVGVEYTANGAIAHNASLVVLNQANATAMTLEAAVAGEFLTIRNIASGTNDHTVTIGNATVDGANNVLTFNAQNEAIMLYGVSTDTYLIVENIGSVGLGT